MTDKDTDKLIEKLYWKGLITDKDLWHKYITGEEALKASNLKAFCERLSNSSGICKVIALIIGETYEKTYWDLAWNNDTSFRRQQQ